MAKEGVNGSRKVAAGADFRHLKRQASRGGRVLLLGLALVSWSARADADVISLGALSFDTSIIGASNRFVVGNFTGTESAPPDFPVLTPLTFVNATLVLSRQGAPDETVSLGDLGPGPHSTIDYLVSDLFTQARFTATVVASVFALVGGDTFLPLATTIAADLVPFAGVLVPGEVVSIDIQGTRVPGVAEPVLTGLVISGASALALIRQRRRRLRV